MGKTVRIQAGQWKGYIGSVSHTTATHVQVELHSRLKKVMVVKERVHVIGDKFGATGENGDGSGFGMARTPFMGGATPMHGGATPMHGGATPMYGGATPMHGGATPMHGGATPSRENYGYALVVIISIHFLFRHCELITATCCFTEDQPRRIVPLLMTFGGLADLSIATMKLGMII
jgi:hypothetical protein